MANPTRKPRDKKRDAVSTRRNAVSTPTRRDAVSTPTRRDAVSTPTRRDAAPYIQMREGTWYAVQHTHELTECCDCSMVHSTEWKVERGRLYWRATVDHKRTAEARAREGITIVRKPPADDGTG